MTWPASPRFDLKAWLDAAILPRILIALTGSRRALSELDRRAKIDFADDSRRGSQFACGLYCVRSTTPTGRGALPIVIPNFSGSTSLVALPWESRVTSLRGKGCTLPLESSTAY